MMPSEEEQSKLVSCRGGELLVPREVSESVQRTGGVESIRERLPSRKELDSMVRLHGALSDGTRLGILHALYLSELCPCLMKELLGLSDSRLSYHLNILEGEGLIAHEQEKNWRIYQITDRGKKALGH
jgi:DNA-binding transcriptional ArsR family regulator